MTALLVIAGLLALLIILLCIPVELLVTGWFHGKAEFRARLYYLFRLVSCDFTARSEKSAPGKHLAVRPASRSISLVQVLEIAQLEGLPEAAWKLANRLIRCVKSKKVEIDLRVSLGDDYDTGMLFGLLLPVKLYLELPPAYDINIQPAFEEDLLLDGSVFGSWQARPIAVMFPCLAFACSRAAWRAGMKMIGYRCSSKN